MAIREAIPSVNAALTKLNENLENHKLSTFIIQQQIHVIIAILFLSVWELDDLLELEYECGTPKRFIPAIEDVLNYLQNVTSLLHGLASFYKSNVCRFDIPRKLMT